MSFLATVKNYGVNYDGWRHPLTPYRAPVKIKTPSSVLRRPIRRDWLLSQNNQTEANKEYPALVVNVFNARRPQGCQSDLGLWRDFPTI